MAVLWLKKISFLYGSHKVVKTRSSSLKMQVDENPKVFAGIDDTRNLPIIHDVKRKKTRCMPRRLRWYVVAQKATVNHT